MSERMEINAIRESMHAQPFRPFQLRLADGRKLTIRHPDFIAVAPNGRRVVVFNDQDGTMSVLEPLLIVSVQAAASSSGKQSGNNPPAGPADIPA